MNYKLFHSSMGYFESNCAEMVDRKLAMGYVFLDELPDDDKKPARKKRIKKVIEVDEDDEPILEAISIEED